MADTPQRTLVTALAEIYRLDAQLFATRVALERLVDVIAERGLDPAGTLVAELAAARAALELSPRR